MANLTHINSKLPAVVLITFNPHETRAVQGKFVDKNRSLQKMRPIIVNGITFTELGEFSGLNILHTTSDQGGYKAQQTISALLYWLRSEEVDVRAVIAVGIAFGVDEKNQKFGDVLVATSVYGYEARKITDEAPEPRGKSYPCSPPLINLFRLITDRPAVKNWPTLHVGCLLSGNTLYDHKSLRNRMVKESKTRAEKAIGGEMEGVGIYHAVELSKIDWILVKGISDWGYGKNRKGVDKEGDQRKAAEKAALVVYEALSIYNYTNPMTKTTQTSGRSRHKTISNDADLIITMSGPDHRFINYEASYNITVSNVGTTVLNNVVVTANLSKGAQFVSVFGRPVTQNHSTVVWQIPSLQPGESKTDTLSLTSPQPSTTVTTVKATSGKISDIASAQIIWEGPPSVRTEISGDVNSIRVGGMVTYAIHITNQGAWRDINTMVKVLFGDEMTPMECDAAGAAIAGKVVTLPDGILKPKSVMTFHIKAKAEQVGLNITRLLFNSSFLPQSVVKDEMTSVY